MDYSKYAQGTAQQPEPTAQKSQPAQSGYGRQQTGGNKPTELICFKSGMSAAKLLQWGQYKPVISVEVRTFDPKKQTNIYKNIQTSSLDAVVNLHKCLGLLIDKLIGEGYQDSDRDGE